MGNQTDIEESTRTNHKGPVVETKIRKSKDGQWIIHQTVITDIKPVAYYREVLKDSGEGSS
jgi:hypothetical protein